MELTNHTALITGGTAGIGLESARLMAEEGASVIVRAAAATAVRRPSPCWGPTHASRRPTWPTRSP
jgi:short-subunit dehydrogenase involved in D-alanine esterification of teichoic acids